MTLSSLIALAQKLPFFNAYFARKTSKNALNLFEQAKQNLQQSSVIALAVVKQNEAKIVKLQTEVNEMAELAAKNQTVITNIDTNLLGNN